MDGRLKNTGGGEMGANKRELLPNASALHFFGAEVRHWRELRGLSTRALGQKVRYSHQFISMIEVARRWPHEDFATRVDVCLETVGALKRLMPAVESLKASQRRAQPASDLGVQAEVPSNG